MGDLTKNLSRSEFRCKCGNCVFKAADYELVRVLQRMVDDLGADYIIITSGIRCELHNEKVGGAANSKHKAGIAADFWLSGVSPRDTVEYLDRKYPDRYGIGEYESFVHLDVRKEKARWRE